MYWIEILMNYFQCMDFNGLYEILILCGFFIKCRRVDMDSLEFKNNASKYHEFWWDFKKLKTHREMPQNSSFYEIQKNPSEFEYHHISMDFK